ncbi:MAG: DUF2630 family protein [Mycobacterium sp.]
MTVRPEEDMDDEAVAAQINTLAEEEHRLEREHAAEGLSEADLARLRSLEVRLDQCWDLLRQRRARRHAGQDPDAAGVRPESTVEGYQQ